MIRNSLTSVKLRDRITCLTILFLIAFVGITILSYAFLPEGFLLNKNNSTNFDTSANLIVCTIQIFLWNMISVVGIAVSSIFAKKRNEHEEYVSLSYWIYFIGVLLAAITLGTWSFTNNIESVPIFKRIIGMFNVWENAGLVELYGQLLITCSLSNKYLIMTYKNKTITRSMKDVRWAKSELICLVVGLLLMFIGAFIESCSILGA